MIHTSEEVMPNREQSNVYANMRILEFDSVGKKFIRKPKSLTTHAAGRLDPLSENNVSESLKNIYTTNSR